MNKWEALSLRKTDEYSTPQSLFEKLNEEFDFTLDPCATDENHKCEKYYTVAEDGLSKSWKYERVFCNPPYSKIGKWVEKAYWETRTENTLVVLLIPARTDTKWFHDFIMYRSEIRFISGRLRFNGLNHNAPFPSMVVIFRGARMRNKIQGRMFE